MNKDDIEIEIQVRVEDIEPLLTFLNKRGNLVLDDYQKDEYYTPSHRDFFAKKPTDEWLRLRESGVSSVTYKDWHHALDGKSNHCDEYETDIRDIDKMRKIFAVLDIKKVITVDKHRRSWDYEDYEISIDEIKDLGTFVEVEYKSLEKVDPMEATEKMLAFLKKLGTGKIERNYVGYPYLLLYGTKGYFEQV